MIHFHIVDSTIYVPITCMVNEWIKDQILIRISTIEGKAMEQINANNGTRNTTNRVLIYVFNYKSAKEESKMSLDSYITAMSNRCVYIVIL